MSFNNCNTRTPTLTAAAPLTFAQDPCKLVYCNYPEQISTNLQYGLPLGDTNRGNHYLNLATVSGDGQLFASYQNQLSYAIYFGIQFYNPTGSTLTVTRQNNGFRAGSSSNEKPVVCGVWSDYFANPDGTVFSLPSGGVAWILDRQIPAGYLFNAVVKFHTSGNLYCIPYLYYNKSMIDGSATYYPWDGGQSRVYRGYGDSYFIEASANVDIGASTTFLTSMCNAGNTNEIVSIREPSTGSLYSCGNGANLGNWGVQYLHTIYVTNSSDTEKTFYAYVGSDNVDSHGYAVINLGGTVKDCSYGVGESWNWLTDSVPGHGAKTYQYQFIHPAQSAGKASHLWTPTHY